ncbi:MAG TPA: hypothetical protein VK822_22750 [Acetobacteraceae bacterium]|nr:hypothetical protein [Acetobacteraceae bacterium]
MKKLSGRQGRVMAQANPLIAPADVGTVPIIIILTLIGIGIPPTLIGIGSNILAPFGSSRQRMTRVVKPSIRP